MSEHKFKAFLRSRRQQWNQNQSRSFVDNALTQEDLPDPDPSDPKSWEVLKAHLVEYKTDEDAIEEVKYIWGLYVAEALGETI